MTDLAIPNTFLSDEDALASEMNANFQAIVDLVNTTGVPKLQDGAATTNALGSGVVTAAKSAANFPGRVAGQGAMTTTYGPASIGSASRTDSRMACSGIANDGTAKLRAVIQFPTVVSSVTGPWALELWDGVVGAGTLLRRKWRRLVADATDSLEMECEIAAFTGSKNFNVAVYNGVGSTGLLTLQASSTIDRCTFDLFWQG